jgi:hypothetical protein
MITKETAEAKLSQIESMLRRITKAQTGSEDAVDKLLEFEEDMARMVKIMESGPKVTLGNYDKYLRFLSEAQEAPLAMLVLWKHGADPVGLVSAFMVMNSKGN